VAEWSFPAGRQIVTIPRNGRSEFPRPLYAYSGYAPIPVRIWILEPPSRDDPCGFEPPAGPGPKGGSRLQREPSSQSNPPGIAIQCGRGAERLRAKETVHPWRSKSNGDGLSLYAVGLGEGR
jgi:hypothetical protein